MKIKYTFMTLMFWTAFSNAQICNDKMEASSKAAQYIHNADGSITDAVNLLVWVKCSHGQVLSGDQCVGSPFEYATWKDALLEAQKFKGFRLPNIKELATLVERSCYQPAIAQAVFSDTPLANYWSNTPSQSGDTYEGRLIDFTDGTEVVRDVNRPKHIRFLIDNN